MKKLMLLSLVIMVVLAVSFVSPAIGSSGPKQEDSGSKQGVASGPKQEAWYAFQVNPYIDIVHLNTNPGGWLNGYDDVLGTHYPVLGFAEKGKFYIAFDGLNTPYTLVFIVGTVATKDGYMYRMTEDLQIDGPYYVWLTPATEKHAEGPSLLEAADSQITPEAWYVFQVNPWINIYHLCSDLRPWLYGYSEPEPYDPILGYAYGGKFYLATDFLPDERPGYYELSFKVGTVSSRDGYSIRTTDGMTYVGPEYFWLTPV